MRRNLRTSQEVKKLNYEKPKKSDAYAKKGEVHGPRVGGGRDEGKLVRVSLLGQARSLRP